MSGGLVVDDEWGTLMVDDERGPSWWMMSGDPHGG